MGRTIKLKISLTLNLEHFNIEKIDKVLLKNINVDKKATKNQLPFLSNKKMTRTETLIDQVVYLKNSLGFFHSKVSIWCFT